MARQLSGGIFFIRKNRSHVTENGRLACAKRKSRHHAAARKNQAKPVMAKQAPKPAASPQAAVVLKNFRSVSCRVEDEMVIVSCSMMHSLIRWGFSMKADLLYPSSGLPLDSVKGRNIFIRAFHGEECVAFAIVDMKKLLRMPG
jgi:hypothetical protein